MKIEATFVFENATTNYGRDYPGASLTEHRLVSAYAPTVVGEMPGPRVDGAISILTAEPIRALLDRRSPMVKVTIEIVEAE